MKASRTNSDDPLFMCQSFTVGTPGALAAAAAASSAAEDATAAAAAAASAGFGATAGELRPSNALLKAQDTMHSSYCPVANQIMSVSTDSMRSFDSRAACVYAAAAAGAGSSAATAAAAARNVTGIEAHALAAVAAAAAASSAGYDSEA